MKQLIKRSFIVLLVLLLMCGLTSSTGEQMGNFNQAVPFGIAHSSSGDNILVFDKPASRSTVGSLDDYTICSVLGLESVNGKTWYKVGFFDQVGFEQTGYVDSDLFFQLTVSGLIKAMQDPDSAFYLLQFTEVAASDNFITASASVARAFVSDELEPQEKEITYVLNTNTKKFHYPWCNSVNDIKAKNRKDFYGSRDEIPSEYVPCKRCNP